MQKAIYWIKCLKKSYEWIDKYEKEFNIWDKASKESIALSVSYGAVYEPEQKQNNLKF